MTDTNKNTPDAKSGWWARCKAGMKKTWEHARAYMGGSESLIGKLYYGSLAVGWASALAAYNGVAGAGQLSLAAFVVARGLKVTWDHVRDIQDATDDGDFNIETAEERIARLEMLVEDQNAVIKEQMDRNSDLAIRLEDLNIAQQVQNFKTSDLDKALDTLKVAIANSKGVAPRDVEETVEDIKRMLIPRDPEVFREKYRGEIEAAKASGLIELTEFDCEKDDFVRTIDDDEPPGPRLG